ncbi:Josephin-1 [Phytophthora boehmeriae]|uniref:ubiquitinyl hydrolase 1 n=1 Tax=Phytophthora boehmeriae TaxID=109152 RepID=A0A8T1WS79_9STRA|nr:Josephin-1 [Phytophthora boehmeriae]
MEERPALYHERQQLYRCGLHALNNVLQGSVFDKASLDAACVELAALSSPGSEHSLLNWAWNAHRAPLGLGNYDVNALTLALQQKGYTMQWLDKRLPVDEKLLPLDAAEGVLCNVVMTSFMSSLWNQRHWFAIRKIEGVCYNLDSKLAAPVPFESESKCYRFLQELVNTGECELFMIKKATTETAEETETPKSAE